MLFVSCAHDQGAKNIEPAPNYIELRDNSIINLYDAFGESNEKMEKDFGFSCILKYNGQTILFDAGTNADIFKKNVEALQIDLTQIDFAIASHPHFDHINGFDYLLDVHPDVKIFFPFDLFWGSNARFNIAGQESTVADSLEKKMQYFGGNFESFQFNQTGRFWGANVQYVRENMEITPGVRLITTSSPYLGYFSKYPNIGLDEEVASDKSDNADNVNLIELNELSLALKTQDGEVLIVGCSHSTVEKIVEETKEYTQNDISLLYGGFHLLPYGRNVLADLAVRLRDDLRVKRVAPTHCTGHLAFKILQDSFKNDDVFAGLGNTVEF